MPRKGIEISEEQQNQIRKMRLNGSTYADIREFFESTYEIKLNDALINRIVKGKTPRPKKRGSYKKRGRASAAASAIAGMRKKRKYTKRGQPAVPIQDELDTSGTGTQEEVENLMRQAFSLHKGNFLYMAEKVVEEQK